jgi:uncharacterized membrane protein YozB (DUF420 family)
MDDFRETAISLTFWYAFLALLVGLLLIVLNDLDAHAACLAGADIALLFALGLIMKSRALNEESIVRGQFWHALPSNKRPASEGGRRMAQSMLERVWLHSAKGAAAVAIALCMLALATHQGSGPAAAQSLPAAVSASE